MKKFLFLCLALLSLIASTNPVFVSTTLAFSEIVQEEKTVELPEDASEKTKSALMAIVVDDFGGWDRSGVYELLNCPYQITCAIMPFVEHSQADYELATKNGKEVILHMPMQAHVNLPQSWYGPVFIENTDSTQTAIEKIEKCRATMPLAKGFNVHIGSGVIGNATLTKSLYDYSVKNDFPFLDSRTNFVDTCEQSCQNANGIYLGRDVFLEPHKQRSYENVSEKLNECAQIAKDKGYSIAIGHVGPEGGVRTAMAITDFCKKNKDVQIVPLSKIYETIKLKQYK